MDRINKTVKELQNMNDADIKKLMHQYPKPSQWSSSNAFAWMQYHLCLLQGRKYMQTGNLQSFFTKP